MVEAMTDALKSNAQHQDIQWGFIQVPVGAINGNDKRRLQAHQRNHKTSEFSKGQPEESQEALNRLFSSIIPPSLQSDRLTIDGSNLGKKVRRVL